MRTSTITLAILLSAMALLAGCAAPVAGPEDRINVGLSESQDRLEITVANSRLVLSLPKGDLQPSPGLGFGSAASPRYFMLKGKETGVVVSGWFEPAHRQADLRASWTREMEGLAKSGFGPPTDVVELELNGMRTILYNVPLDKGSSAHARASYVRSDTWIDLHLSVSGDSSAAQLRSRLETLLNSLQVTDKSQ